MSEKPDYVLRAEVEYNELREKTLRLSTFLDHNAEGLNPVERTLMIGQLGGMMAYLNFLWLRLNTRIGTITEAAIIDAARAGE